jgi:hypothetical protein
MLLTREGGTTTPPIARIHKTRQARPCVKSMSLATNAGAIPGWHAFDTVTTASQLPTLPNTHRHSFPTWSCQKHVSRRTVVPSAGGMLLTREGGTTTPPIARIHKTRQARPCVKSMSLAHEPPHTPGSVLSCQAQVPFPGTVLLTRERRTPTPRSFAQPRPFFTALVSKACARLSSVQRKPRKALALGPQMPSEVVDLLLRCKDAFGHQHADRQGRFLRSDHEHEQTGRLTELFELLPW